MPVEIAEILHVLAHELRTPVGIAHGYVRLLLEDRLPEEPDRRRALAQIQKALTRLTELSHETSALAAWHERDVQHWSSVAARAIVDRVAATDYEWPLEFDVPPMNEEAFLQTPDPDGLVIAIANVVRATARESRGAACAVAARAAEHHLDVLVGPPTEANLLGAGPSAPDAGPIELERGGVGLTLVHAAVVLYSHGAECWTMKRFRHTAGIRLPLEDRQSGGLA